MSPGQLSSFLPLLLLKNSPKKKKNVLLKLLYQVQSCFGLEGLLSYNVWCVENYPASCSEHEAASVTG